MLAQERGHAYGGNYASSREVQPARASMSSEPAPEAAIDFEASGSCPDKFLRLDGRVTSALGAIELTQFDRAEGAGHAAVQAQELVWAATGSLKIDGGLGGGLTRHARPCRLDLPRGCIVAPIRMPAFLGQHDSVAIVSQT